jgi:hypothetical protein
MKKRLVRLRAISNETQDSRCYYCGVVMWLGDPSTFRARFDLKRKRVEAFQCTAEHLKARCEGGLDKAGNVVAACSLCIRRRHQGHRTAPPPAEYRRQVRTQLGRGKWHDPWAFDLGLVSRHNFDTVSQGSLKTAGR